MTLCYDTRKKDTSMDFHCNTNGGMDNIFTILELLILNELITLGQLLSTLAILTSLTIILRGCQYCDACMALAGHPHIEGIKNELYIFNIILDTECMYSKKMYVFQKVNAFEFVRICV